MSVRTSSWRSRSSPPNIRNWSAARSASEARKEFHEKNVVTRVLTGPGGRGGTLPGDRADPEYRPAPSALRRLLFGNPWLHESHGDADRGTRTETAGRPQAEHVC